MLTSFPTPSIVIYALNACAAGALAQRGDETRRPSVDCPQGIAAAVPLNVGTIDWRKKKALCYPRPSGRGMKVFFFERERKSERVREVVSGCQCLLSAELTQLLATASGGSPSSHCYSIAI